VGARSFLESLDALAALSTALDDRQLLAPSRCFGWARLDVLHHLHLGLQEMLGGFVCATTAEPTVNFATYWTAFADEQTDADPIPGMLFIRRGAGAYSRPGSLVRHLSATLPAVRAAAASSDPTARVHFQGYLLGVEDFLTTWAVEVAIHHLDVTNGDAALPSPPPAALADARRTLAALLGADLPAHWSDETAALKGTGRLPLDEADRAALGDLATRFPLLG